MMDCNKEEAIRAKALAEKKMQNKDFSGAHKVALKAQKLCPDLEDIVQMLIVCDVHCSAEKKLFGNEMDWYGILQVAPTADEATIKQQFRKFALQLHPDKNKFAGAEAAFKLIGEAQRVLLDRGKRLTHDLKCRGSVFKPAMPFNPPQNACMSSNFGVQNELRSYYTKVNLQYQPPQPQDKAGFDCGYSTFWTACPFCLMRYQYYRTMVNKLICCQKCNKQFMAYDLNLQGVSPANSRNPHSFSQQKVDLNQGACKGDIGFQGKPDSKMESSQKGGRGSGVASENLVGKKRKKLISESSESSESINGAGLKVEIDLNGVAFHSNQESTISKEQCVRRSTRKKLQVSYAHNLSDDGQDRDGLRHKTGKQNLEASRMNEHCGLKPDVENEKQVRHEPKAKKTSEDHDNSTQDLKTEANVTDFYKYPDSEFADFDKDKKEENFAVGQIWATYDTKDAMPRFYAQIKKVFSPGFKLRIRWLEPDPEDEKEKKWVDEELPVSCGKFVLGDYDDIGDHSVFSHQVNWEKGNHQGTFKVYPRKGETWALFKNWDIQWYANVEAHGSYEYEFVEILSNYVEDKGIHVAYLGKLKGFVSLFTQIAYEGVQTFQVAPRELFRFSHRVPSFKMTGEEPQGVPIGSFELDSVSLPANFEEFGHLEDKEVNFRYGQPGGSSSHVSYQSQPNISSSGLAMEKVNLEQENKYSINRNDDGGSQEVIEILESGFHDFRAQKSQEKLRIGQIWAMYADGDGLPKHYGQIRRVIHSPCFRVLVKRLSSSQPPDCTTRWHDKDKPISCWRFKIGSGKSKLYDSTTCFSHLPQVDSVGEGEYAIFPRKGEVWALDKNQTTLTNPSDSKSCKFEVVEILEENDLWIRTMVLEPVNGHGTVFKVQRKGRAAVTMEIPQSEFLGFSFQIPFYKIEDGRLKGFYELDPDALPVYFCTRKKRN